MDAKEGREPLLKTRLEVGGWDGGEKEGIATWVAPVLMLRLVRQPDGKGISAVWSEVVEEGRKSEASLNPFVGLQGLGATRKHTSLRFHCQPGILPVCSWAAVMQR